MNQRNKTKITKFINLEIVKEYYNLIKMIILDQDRTIILIYYKITKTIKNILEKVHFQGVKKYFMVTNSLTKNYLGQNT